LAGPDFLISIQLIAALRLKMAAYDVHRIKLSHSFFFQNFSSDGQFVEMARNGWKF
jgi:hypothetical protein